MVAVTGLNNDRRRECPLSRRSPAERLERASSNIDDGLLARWTLYLHDHVSVLIDPHCLGPLCYKRGTEH
jgi:phage gp36-like protein